MFGVLEGFSAIWVVIGVGYLLGRSNALGPHGRPVLNKLTFFVASPALLFTTISTADPYAVVGPQLVIAGVAALVTMGASWALTRWWLNRSSGERIISSMAASTVNAGNLGLPIAAYVLGDATLAAPVILFQLAFFTPMNLMMMDVATGHASGGVKGFLKGIAKNPMIVASAAALLVAFLRVDVPDIIETPIDLISGASIPAMLLAFGISLVGSRPLRKEDHRRSDVWAATAFKLVFHPLIAYVLAAFVFRLHGTELFGAVVLASLPTAQNIFVNASRYDTGVVVSKDIVLVTTVLGIPAMFLVAALLG